MGLGTAETQRMCLSSSKVVFISQTFSVAELLSTRERERSTCQGVPMLHIWKVWGHRLWPLLRLEVVGWYVVLVLGAQRPASKLQFYQYKPGSSGEQDTYC